VNQIYLALDYCGEVSLTRGIYWQYEGACSVDVVSAVCPIRRVSSSLSQRPTLLTEVFPTFHHIAYFQINSWIILLHCVRWTPWHSLQNYAQNWILYFSGRPENNMEPEEFYLLGHNAVTSVETAWTRWQTCPNQAACFRMLLSIFCPEDGGYIFLSNCWLSTVISKKI
jgi:hypothetical protein